jgi:hypothetical protein
MITVNGRLVAVIVLTLAGAAVFAIGIVSGISNRVTGHEALAGFIALLVAAAAGAWLRRDRLNRRQS